MSIGIVFVVLAVAMVLGPIMLMKPSGRQRQLAGFRQEALEQGLQSRISSVPSELKAFTVAPTIAVYQQRWHEKRFKAEGSYLLYRTGFQHDIHFYKQWDWMDGQAAEGKVNQALKSCLDSLPESILAIEITALGIGFFWLEKSCTVEQLKAFYLPVINWVEEQDLLETKVDD